MSAKKQAPIVITIDGPAGSGKSTTAREVALRLGFRHLDSGSLYRALTVAVVRAGIPEEAWDRVDPDALSRLDVKLVPTDEAFVVFVEGADPGEALRSPTIARLSSRLARNRGVREKLLEIQRSALCFGNLVADGRDMGTVVFPEADLKVFLTATLEARARRRVLQEGKPADEESVSEEAEQIYERDEADTRRAVAPLRTPAGALEIDTARLSFEDQVERIATVGATLTAKPGEK